MLRGGYNGAAAALASASGIQVGEGLCHPRRTCPRRLAQSQTHLHSACLGWSETECTLPLLTRAQPLVELHIFEGAQGVVDALRAHNCGELQCLPASGHLPAVVQCGGARKSSRL